MDDAILLQAIALLPFDGRARAGTYVGAGPRRKFIVNALRKGGAKPREDAYGNVWVERGSRGGYLLQSAHLDVDPTRGGPPEFAVDATPAGPRYRGDLDNAVGCSLLVRAALAHPSRKRALYVFTASEEEDPETEEWGVGARNAVRELERRGIVPDLSIAVDVSPTRLRITQEAYDAMPNEVWDATPASEIYDTSDPTHCYLDGFAADDSASRSRAEALASRFARRDGAPVAVRAFAGYDEAAIYRALSPAFAFGPVFQGKQDEPDQAMPAAHVETAARFLRFIAESRK